MNYIEELNTIIDNWNSNNTDRIIEFKVSCIDYKGLTRTLYNCIRGGLHIEGIGFLYRKTFNPGATKQDLAKNIIEQVKQEGIEERYKDTKYFRNE